MEAKQHDSGAADLEKVTDYAEDKEIVSTGIMSHKEETGTE